MAQERIFLCGPHGSGKSALVSSLLDTETSLLTLSGSALLAGKEKTIMTDYRVLDARSEAAIKADQERLVELFCAACAENPQATVLFDGHLVISKYMDPKRMTFVEPYIVKAMGITTLLYLNVQDDVIVKRRRFSARACYVHALDTISVKKEVAFYRDYFTYMANTLKLPHAFLRDDQKLSMLKRIIRQGYL